MQGRLSDVTGDVSVLRGDEDCRVDRALLEGACGAERMPEHRIA